MKSANADRVMRGLETARRRQTERVMNVIGPLLDAWEAVPNDFKSAIEDEAPHLVEFLNELDEAVEKNL
jgi:hypothetical protein